LYGKPFNAFLSGFSATVGQFVLTASLRIQTTEANKKDFPSVSPERYVPTLSKWEWRENGC
jgi:DAD family